MWRPTEVPRKSEVSSAWQPCSLLWFRPGEYMTCGHQKARVLKSSLRARQFLNHKLNVFCYFDRLATFISSVFTLSGAVSTLPSLRSMVTTHLQADGPSEYIIPVLVSTT